MLERTPNAEPPVSDGENQKPHRGLSALWMAAEKSASARPPDAMCARTQPGPAGNPKSELRNAKQLRNPKARIRRRLQTTWDGSSTEYLLAQRVRYGPV